MPRKLWEGIPPVVLGNRQKIKELQEKSEKECGSYCE
jgi:hypothetical protein